MRGYGGGSERGGVDDEDRPGTVQVLGAQRTRTPVTFLKVSLRSMDTLSTPKQVLWALGTRPKLISSNRRSDHLAGQGLSNRLIWPPVSGTPRAELGRARDL